jgi:hypothetical protein
MASYPLGGDAGQDRAGIAWEVNRRILELEARLDDESFLARDPSQHLIGFLCECGCLGIVAKTRSEYESKGGAWIEGHESLQASA